MGMAPDSPVAEGIRNLDDLELQRLVALEREDWTEEAYAFAVEELETRGLERLSDTAFFDAHPEEVRDVSGVCQSCAERGLTVLDEFPVLFMFVGVRAIPSRDPCPACRAREVRLWWPLVPLIPLGRTLVRGA